MAGSRPILHLPVAAALCTGLYAVSLAGVTALQAAQEAAITAARAPLVDATNRVSVSRRATLDGLRRATEALQAATDRYRAAVAASGELDTDLAALAAQVSALTGAAAHLAQTQALPAAPGGVGSVAPPPVQGTTGASGL